MTDAELRCRCGKVEGRVADASPRTVNRVVCYCRDCQAYLHYLERKDLLDAHGGTDIVQVAPAALTFRAGTEQIHVLRLKPKGLYRLFSRCCHTPLGNTVGTAIPFIGVVAKAFEGHGGAPDADALFGPPVGRIYGRYAIGEPPPGSTGLNPRLFARAIRMVLGWRLRGKACPHPYFHRDGSLKYDVTVLTREQRGALRRR